MSNPKISDIRSNSKARFKVQQNTTKALQSKYVGLQRNLYSLLLARVIDRLQVDSSGNILPSDANKVLIINSGYLQRFLDNKATPQVIGILNDSFKRLDVLAFDKASLFQNVNQLKAGIQNRSKEVLGLKPRGQQEGGFFSSMRNDKTVYNKVKAQLNFGVSAQLSIDLFKKQTRDLILGNDNKLGVIANFQELTMQSGSASEMYDRFVQNEYSRAISLNYAIYQGGEIETTRPFCDARNAGVYTREEILAWNNEDWEGKKTPNNIILDAGGYNCRHYYDWISYELARQLRPDIARSAFDLV